MTPTWFNSVKRIQALEKTAAAWVGTPFVANSRVKGPQGGVSCQMLVEQLYIEAGHNQIPFGADAASMRWSETHRDSLIEKFFSSHPDFFRSVPHSSRLPGDIVGFRLGGCVHHLGVALLNGRFIHSMRGLGTKICNLTDPTYAKRIDKIWRPKP